MLPVKFVEEGTPVGAILTLTLAIKLPLDKAKSMAKLLLDLGATSSQADLDGRTVLLQYASSGLEEMFHLLVEHDQTGVQAAINHRLVPMWRGPLETSPLDSAIISGNIGLVLSLLNAGAKLELDFETFLKAAKVSDGAARLGSFDKNQEFFNERRTHPLITALHNNPNTDLAITLLEKGADPNALTQPAYYALQTKYLNRNNNNAGSVLDVVRGILAHLQRYNPVRAKPVIKPGMDEFLSRYAEGTYQHWVVSRDIARKKGKYEDKMKEYEKQTCSGRSKKQEIIKEARTAALKDMISGLEELEELLVSKGAKTFAELHPEIALNNLPHHTDARNEKPAETKPYEYNFNVRGSTDLTQSRKDAYIEL